VCNYQGYEFGAGRYPDSVCMDGRLFDADNCDDKGNLYEPMEEIPCPMCNEKGAVLGMSGCAKTAPLPTAQWESRPMYGGSENRLLIRDDTGEVLIDIIHGSGPGDTWDVCRGNGTCDKDFATEQQAKTRGESLVKAVIRQ
jgi:hypothetical protein